MMLSSKLIYDSKSMKKTTKKINTPNTFYMKGDPKTSYKNTIIIDFEPEKSIGFIHQSMKDLQKPSSLIPTFNADTKIFTPTFVVPSIKLDVEHYSQKFEQKLAQYQQIDLQEIMVPRPRNKDYCNVCEVKFADYLQHSQSAGHCEELHKNKFQKRIRKFCRKFQKRYVRTLKSKESYQQREESYSESPPREQTLQKRQQIQILQ